MKQHSVIPYIKDQLYRDGKYYKMSKYELWGKYNKQRQKDGFTGMKYDSFLKYIYVLEVLDLIRKTTPPRGVKRTPKPGDEHPSDFIPDEWKRVFVEAVPGYINHYRWINPWKEYRIIHGAEKYWGSEEAKERHREELAEKRAEARYRTALHPSAEDYVTIKISKKLKKAIDIERVKVVGGIKTIETVNQYLTTHLFRRGRDEDLVIAKE